jgi:hypothetical protein
MALKFWKTKKNTKLISLFGLNFILYIDSCGVVRGLQIRADIAECLQMSEDLDLPVRYLGVLVSIQSYWTSVFIL